jgi:hypothetical protein
MRPGVVRPCLLDKANVRFYLAVLNDGLPAQLRFLGPPADLAVGRRMGIRLTSVGAIEFPSRYDRVALYVSASYKVRLPRVTGAIEIRTRPRSCTR